MGGVGQLSKFHACGVIGVRSPRAEERKARGSSHRGRTRRGLRASDWAVLILPGGTYVQKYCKACEDGVTLRTTGGGGETSEINRGKGRDWDIPGRNKGRCGRAYVMSTKEAGEGGRGRGRRGEGEEEYVGWVGEGEGGMLRLWGEFTIELCVVVVVVVVWQPLSRFGGSSAPSFDFRVDLEVPAKILFFLGRGSVRGGIGMETGGTHRWDGEGSLACRTKMG